MRVIELKDGDLVRLNGGGDIMEILYAGIGARRKHLQATALFGFFVANDEICVKAVQLSRALEGNKK